MQLQQANKGRFQMAAAQAVDELTAVFLAGFYPVRQLSVRRAPMLDP